MQDLACLCYATAHFEHSQMRAAKGSLDARPRLRALGNSLCRAASISIGPGTQRQARDTSGLDDGLASPPRPIPGLAGLIHGRGN
jgi:hypothetical protein